MNSRLKLLWMLSILLTACLSAGLIGSGTSAVFSDSVTLRQQIRTGHVKLTIVKIDDVALDPPADERVNVQDTVKGTDVDVTRVVELRNDGTLTIHSLHLTTTLGGNDVRGGTDLRVTVTLKDAAGTSTATRTLDQWQGPARRLDLPGALPPRATVTVELHTVGTIDDARSPDGVQPAYRFTGTDQ